ncbi:hypothetical protein L0664_00170 [Octadecabacter sp. G9-8]|uniref:Uncharacterized protein n=1 Tax=Octadecabacter dasysiphoniae TaxID=2909341 RepID=A0ABS9CQF2_9RHOB|nr:hypothetical protein [Octadecabacter dasysiphoniae]MCF2869464.1 hypothetical protein [Octadecabacter dasysiphoniae]
MTNGIGRALWEIYEDAVKSMPNETDAGVAGATLKFVAAFEQELEAAKIDIYCKSALQAEQNNQAIIRQNRLSSV